MPSKPIFEPGSRKRPTVWVNTKLWNFVLENLNHTDHKNMQALIHAALEREKHIITKGLKNGGKKVG